MGVTRQTWAEALLADLGDQPTSEHLVGLIAWESAEDTAAECNPLATTEPAPGASNFNPVGVKDYPTFAEGLAATVATLRNGDYPGILAALANPAATAEDICNAVAGSPWGTGRLAVTMVAQVREHGAVYSDHPVAGAGELPGAEPPAQPAPPAGPVVPGFLAELVEGASGADVLLLQVLLTRAGAQLAWDGAFGPATRALVVQYQQAKGLAVDGVVGPQTWASLLAK